MIQVTEEEAMAVIKKFPNVKVSKTVGKRYIPEYKFVKSFLEQYRDGKVIESITHH